MTTSFDPNHLETLVVLAQTRSFTEAARRRGIGQPAVSQHVRKLEIAAGRQLVLRDTHSVTLTADGEAMVGFARGILSAQEAALGYFRGERPSGRLRLGMSDDLALTGMPQILRDFRRDNPLVDLELTVDLSGTLQRRLEQNRLDLFLGKRAIGDSRGSLIRRDRLVWVGLPSTRIDRSRPLPLVVYPPPSISRSQMEQALERAALPWRSVCLCRGVNGLIAAVAAGIGISTMAESLVPAGLVELGKEHRLPELGSVDLVLLSNPRAAEKASVRALSAMLLAS
ncbi:DNA-binding transcriptional LysR family regulator [Motilibacter rhizosphaerae]|uniref:DNA-binding transcriptional LysR family regulator n=1 Tax=Motilibacter rhizosphaerae TaxID=598652 RepID=A0A4Q7NRI7_9ACTN|nr:LysR family transcriptional regulator [Motilibacter rhizosphaerae]RZS89677.1 DNA-binding transcriptional LysR family regulator [Motilibacter rhizosphaerae]